MIIQLLKILPYAILLGGMLIACLPPQVLWIGIVVPLLFIIPVQRNFLHQWIGKLRIFRKKKTPKSVLGSKNERDFLWDGKSLQIFFEILPDDGVYYVDRSSQIPTVPYEKIQSILGIIGEDSTVQVLTIGTSFDPTNAQQDSLWNLIGRNYGFVHARTIIIVQIDFSSHIDQIMQRSEDVELGTLAYGRLLAARLSFHLSKMGISHTVLSVKFLGELVKKSILPETFYWGKNSDYEIFNIIDPGRIPEYLRINSLLSHFLIQINGDGITGWIVRKHKTPLESPLSRGITSVAGSAKQVCHSMHPQLPTYRLAGKHLTDLPEIPIHGNGIYLGKKDTEKVFWLPTPGSTTTIWAPDHYWEVFTQRVLSAQLPISHAGSDDTITIKNRHTASCVLRRMSDKSRSNIIFDAQGTYGEHAFDVHLSSWEKLTITANSNDDERVPA